MVAGDRFEAWCQCPACERFACHHMRAANPYDNLIAVKQDDVALMKIRNYDYNEWRASSRCGSFSSEMTELALFLAREGRKVFDVIRMCECGNEWGQA